MTKVGGNKLGVAIEDLGKRVISTEEVLREWIIEQI